MDDDPSKGNPGTVGLVGECWMTHTGTLLYHLSPSYFCSPSDLVFYLLFLASPLLQPNQQSFPHPEFYH